MRIILDLVSTDAMDWMVQESKGSTDELFDRSSRFIR
jgi:hypothetical protein